MGVVEMYRTTRDPKYLELVKKLIDIRGHAGDIGTDDNQDRIPFRRHEKSVGARRKGQLLVCRGSRCVCRNRR